MGNARIGAAKIAVIEKIVDKAVDAWTWHLGEDVNPDLLDSEVLSGAYDAVFEAIRTDLDEFAGRQGEVGWAQESLRSPLVPEIWQRISDRGIFYDYDYDQLQQCFVGEVRTATKRDIMGRLLRKGTFIYREWIRWNKEHTEKRTKTRKKKQTLQTRWNQEVVDRFNELALVAMERPEGTLKEQIAQRLVGLQWFVGRRAWIELGVQADFALSDGPAWADGWLTFSGHAKRRPRKRTGSNPRRSGTFQFLESTLSVSSKRSMSSATIKSSQPWYDPDHPKPNVMVKEALNYSVQKVLNHGFVADAMRPVHDAGYEYEVTLHRFRDLYASRGHAYRDSQDPRCPFIGVWAATYLGHFGNESERDTGEYLQLKFLGDRAIPKIN